GPGPRENAGQPAPEPEAERANLWRPLRQDDGGFRRQGLLHRGAEGPEECPASGAGLPRPGPRQRADLPRVRPQAATVPLAQLIRSGLTAGGRSATGGLSSPITA